MRKVFTTILIILLIGAALGAAALGALCWYDRNVDRSGWTLMDGSYAYLDFYGNPVTGWTNIDGNRYYFTPESGAMATYWQEIDGSRYYFSGDGTMDTGFWDIDGSRYYFTPDGVMQTGWLEWNANQYYLDEQGAMVTSWQEIDGSRYYFRSNGTMVTGFQTLTGDVYRFLEDGRLYTGWDVMDGNLTYYLPEGPRASGWQEIEGARYYFGSDGIMRTGWLKIGENNYYLQEDGTAATSPTVIDGETYYFSPKGIHVVLVNEHIKVPDYYKPELKTIEEWHQVSAACYKSLMRMLSDCKAAGIEYNFNSAYRTVAQQSEILELRTEEYMNQGHIYQIAYAKARETVALPGTSEHHLGLAVDLVGDEAVAWFNEHCWEYGFIVRYRAEKAHITGIIDEPWHFRYVGKDVAMDMKTNGLCLEEYLGFVPPDTAPSEPTEPTESE